MTIKFDVTAELVNSQFAPVAALAAYYQDQNVLEPFQKVVPAVKKSDFSLPNQLTQVLLSILSGCEYLSVVNTRLRPERRLAQLYRMREGINIRLRPINGLNSIFDLNLCPSNDP